MTWTSGDYKTRPKLRIALCLVFLETERSFLCIFESWELINFVHTDSCSFADPNLPQKVLKSASDMYVSLLGETGTCCFLNILKGHSYSFSFSLSLHFSTFFAWFIIWPERREAHVYLSSEIWDGREFVWNGENAQISWQKSVEIRGQIWSGFQRN